MNPRPDLHMAPILERMRAAPALDYRTMPIAAARVLFEEMARPWNEPPLAIAEIKQLSVPGPAGPIRARLYLPHPNETRPLVIFAHGGGWAFGSIDTHDNTMRHAAQNSGCAVLGIDYRLAPEHPFPAGFEDVLAAIRFAKGGGCGTNVDASRLALAGDSAGANLALAAAIHCLRTGEADIRTAALFYGCFAPDFETESHKRCGDGSYMLGTEMMRWYWRNFLGHESEATTSLAAPSRADLAGLPPLYLNAAGLDPLLDDTFILGRRLAAAGVRHRIDVFPGVVHGFMRMTRELPTAREAHRAAGEFLARELNSS